MVEANYMMRASAPQLECPECGNNSVFTVAFNDSMLVVEYSTGNSPRVVEWTDTGLDSEVTCDQCGSKDITIDEFL